MGKYKKVENPKKSNKLISKEHIDSALHKIQSTGMSIRKAAKKINIDKSSVFHPFSI